MKGYKLAATDGEFGRVKDFLFDEEHWTVRYLVADTGRWIPHRKVLIAPVSLGTPDWEAGSFPVKLSKEEVEMQPELDADAAVSRKYEQQWYQAYDYPYYYSAGSTLAWGYGATPALLDVQRDEETAAATPMPPMDKSRCLRSIEELRGCSVEAADGVIGKVDDIIMDDETWGIRYLIINTKGRLEERLIILAPGWFESIDWEEKTLISRMAAEKTDAAPAYSPGIPLTRTAEKSLYHHYGDSASWMSVTGRSEPII